MTPQLKLALFSFLSTAATTVLAQPGGSGGSPGGGVSWLAVVVAFGAGVAVGYVVGKQSGSKDDKDK